ncbi:MAG: hypothetical protein DRR16_17395 [Candidatus Parabeggiatoa sp. nov. 3]|nr:MAG: hypothetical protein DRR00_33195 [Gammaproteobacteria bacterium]RKZ52788.1 MAG: hypothetical protein DRQ99_32230 [Gammaproteobacteria bacterium]RKZ83369.1 MAG: hypothetical protein DRR16_17395 [Gammaproteobacteria bacterium]
MCSIIKGGTKNLGEHARAAPTTPEYVGFCRGISACLPLTKVVLRWNLGWNKINKNSLKNTDQKNLSVNTLVQERSNLDTT